MKYLRRELNQVEKNTKTIWQDSLNRVVLHDPDTKDKQEVQDTIDILKEAMAKNKPTRTSSRGNSGRLLSYRVFAWLYDMYTNHFI